MSLINVFSNFTRVFTKKTVADKTTTKVVSSYLKVIYPLINVSKRAKGKYRFEELQDFSLRKMELSDTELAIETAVAIKNLNQDYVIKPLRNGDFIISRSGARAIVSVKTLAESIFHKAADGLTRDHIDDLVAKKNRFKCDAAIMVSIPNTTVELQFYSKVNDVFGISSFDLMELLNTGDIKRQLLAA
ncbi:hypothetical protein [Colwellia sp. Arc7-D]|uniref:hypothetical protein n=1 Tax=Colwellia sp. Arc7-D TaxID=2161872 RepID=UPI000D37115C|nr:hypothetical protein [Colwellia sp. Arc7-D]AWB56228.1 hypothetical protein DBO93_00690 [Colwellia sp. Arc7-D]